MKKSSSIYIAGHSGLVGSAIRRTLESRGYSNLILRTHKQLDLTNRAATERFFAKHRPEYVFLAAARVGGIWANNTYPAQFIYDNIMIAANVIDIAHKYGVKKLLYLGSTCIYPKLAPQPMPEEALLSGPIEPTNEPYAISKIAGIKLCRSYKRQYGDNFISVIPCNSYGIGDNFGEGGHVVAALLSRFHKAAQEGQKTVEIWGTGKPRREFIYADDMADACVFLMQKYSGLEPINIGTGSDVSIKSLSAMVKRVTGYKGKIVFDTTKPDGMPRRLLDSSRLLDMGWKPKTQLEQGLKQTYQGFLENR